MTKSEYIIRSYEKQLWKKHGITEGSNLLYPLAWYINTGRASADYIHRLAEADPKKVTAILEKDGSVQDVLDRLKVLLYKLK